MEKISMEEARKYAIGLVKKHLAEKGVLDLRYIDGINDMLAYIQNHAE